MRLVPVFLLPHEADVAERELAPRERSDMMGVCPKLSRRLRVLFYLFLLFVLVPLTELFLLFKLADMTSPATTLALVIVTGAIGSLLARAQGFRMLNRVRAELAAGKMPADALVDAVMIFVAGALLLTPGMLTDAFGFSLLVPICRRIYRGWARSWFRRNFKIQTFPGGAGQQPSQPSQVIDSYVVDSSDKKVGGE